LANLVRASTAAPFYFDPEWIEIAEGQPPGLFVDGGVTPHNNPALIIFLMTILKPFNINWETGADKLTVVSIRHRRPSRSRGAGRTRHGPHGQTRDPRAHLGP